MTPNRRTTRTSRVLEIIARLIVHRLELDVVHRGAACSADFLFVVEQTKAYPALADLYVGAELLQVVVALGGHVGHRRRELIEAWRATPEDMEPKGLLKLIDSVGKGRFSQRLAALLVDEEPPEYIRNAIRFVVDRV